MLKKITYRYSIDPTFKFKEEVKWIIGVFASYSGVNMEFTTQVEDCIFLSEEVSSPIRLNSTFFNTVYDSTADFTTLLNTHLDICFEDGKVDVLSTAFYFLNCLWEKDKLAVRDHWGRSEFKGSIWEKNGYNKPFSKVNQQFDQFALRLAIEIKPQDSYIFLSHDIDVVYGAYLEDGFALLKKGKFVKSVQVMMEHVFKGPQWFNFRKIAQLEKKFGFSSTFFWIALKGKEEGIGKNADYEINSKEIRDEISWLETEGFSNALHKSISPKTFQEELSMIGFKPVANRYHYLKYNFEQLISEMNQSGLKMDASLGYAQVLGYRNGYTLPYVPFDLVNRRMCSFLEVPLCIMDGTLSSYQKLNGESALNEIEKFIEEHSKNSVISVLWHNSHFTDHKYKGYPAVYEKLLNNLKQKEIKSVSPEELITRYFTDVH